MAPRWGPSGEKVGKKSQRNKKEGGVPQSPPNLAEIRRVTDDIKTVESSNRDLQFQKGSILEFMVKMMAYDETMICT